MASTAPAGSTRRVEQLGLAGVDRAAISIGYGYPGVANAEVLNYLMAAYCPVVARLAALGDAQKRARMDRVGSPDQGRAPNSRPGLQRVRSCRQASVETRPPGGGRASVTLFRRQVSRGSGRQTVRRRSLASLLDANGAVFVS